MKLLLPAVGTCALALLSWSCNLNQLGRIEAGSTGDLQFGTPPRGAFDADLTAACGPGGATDAGAAAFSRFPYLQRATASSVDVVWTSATPAEIEVWPAGDESAARAIEAEIDDSAVLAHARQFVAEIDGLEAGTIYCYRMTGEGGEWQRPTGFRTAPAPGSGEPIRIIAFGDSGSGSTDQVTLLDQMMNYEADMAIVAGDVAYESGTLQQFEDNYFAIYQPMLDRIPFFPASGNHEYETDDAEPFRDVFVLPENGGPDGLERWYSYDWGDLHVAVLDTEVDFAAQAEWLREDLEKNELPWTIVLLHRPPYTAGDHGADLEVRETFHPIFVEHEVDLVVTGHDHHYERVVPQQGVNYIVTGGGGRGVREKLSRNEYTAFAEPVAHFVYLVIEDGALTAWAIDGTGQVFDSFRIGEPVAAEEDADAGAEAAESVP